MAIGVVALGLAAASGRLGHAENGAVAISGKPLVFIHGIKGATLVDGAGESHWLTLWQVLNIGTKPLALPLRWNGDTQAGDDLRPVEIMGRLRVIPWLLEAPLYGPWLEAARSWGRPFYSFAYDWRRDPQETAYRFEAFLTKVQSDHGGQRPEVVAHSLGGLITMAVVNRRPELFSAVFFAGTPFSGGVGFLPDLTEGEATGINRRILGPEVLGTFPSVYDFLPLDGSGIVDRSGRSLPFDFFDAAEWKKNAWGLFREKGDAEAKEKFLKMALARARAFRERLENAKPVSYPPIIVIAGREHPTLTEVLRQGKRFDFSARPKQPGDGRVAEKSALPPSGIPYHVEYSEADHAGLLNDPKVIALIREFSLNARWTAGKPPSGR